jgi:hypothetical protein
MEKPVKTISAAGSWVLPRLRPARYAAAAGRVLSNPHCRARNTWQRHDDRDSRAERFVSGRIADCEIWLWFHNLF